METKEHDIVQLMERQQKEKVSQRIYAKDESKRHKQKETFLCQEMEFERNRNEIRR